MAAGRLAASLASAICSAVVDDASAMLTPAMVRADLSDRPPEPLSTCDSATAPLICTLLLSPSLTDRSERAPSLLALRDSSNFFSPPDCCFSSSLVDGIERAALRYLRAAVVRHS